MISTANRSTIGAQGADQIAWAAGLFEGEGSIYVERERESYVGLSMSLSSTDEDVVRRFRDCVGGGRIFGPYSSAKSTKPYWTWKLRNVLAVTVLAGELYPFLGARRRAQVDAALEARKGHVPGKIGRRPGPRRIEGQIGMSC